MELERHKSFDRTYPHRFVSFCFRKAKQNETVGVNSSLTSTGINLFR
jgi:hypothetical protein